MRETWEKRPAGGVAIDVYHCGSASDPDFEVVREMKDEGRSESAFALLCSDVFAVRCFPMVCSIPQKESVIQEPPISYHPYHLIPPDDPFLFVRQGR